MTTSFISHAFADNLRLVKSKLIIDPSDDTYLLSPIPKFAFVKSVWLQVVEAADVNPEACEVGWQGNGETAVTNGFISTDIADPTVTGLKKAMKDTLVAFEGKYFSDASGMLTFTYAAGDATTLGSFYIFAEYIVIH